MKINDFFTQNKILLAKQTFVLAISGGPDSMALLDMMNSIKDRYHLKLIAAHFDHQLRPDSGQEEVVIKQYCQRHRLIFENGYWDKKKQPNVGIEAAARHYRYAFLAKIVSKYQANYLVTAHHNDDLLENILLKFIRSGNPEEMNSLQEIGQMHGTTLLRPLLSFSKQELLDYDLTQKISFIEDKTNAEDETMRNRLRHYVIPLLKQENPALKENGLRFIKHMDILKKLAQKQIQKITQPELFLEVSYRLKEDHLSALSPQERVYYWQNFIWSQWHRRVNDNLAGYHLEKYQGYFYLWPERLQVSQTFYQVKVEEKFNFNDCEFIISRHAHLNYQCVGDFWANESQFFVGNLHPGVKLKLQNGQHAKAKKMFAQAKIPNFLRHFCLTIYNKKREPIWLQKTYQEQEWLKSGQRYYVYLLKKCKNEPKD